MACSYRDAVDTLTGICKELKIDKPRQKAEAVERHRIRLFCTSCSAFYILSTDRNCILCPRCGHVMDPHTALEPVVWIENWLEIDAKCTYCSVSVSIYRMLDRNWVRFWKEGPQSVSMSEVRVVNSRNVKAG